MIPADNNVLTNIMHQCHALLDNGPQRLQTYAIGLLMLLLTIDITLKIIDRMATTDSRGGLLQSTVVLDSILTYGFFAYLVVGITGQSGYTVIVNAIQDSFVFLGLKASGTGMTPAQFTSPSGIAGRGMDLAWHLIFSPTAEDINMIGRVIMYLCGLGVVIAFFLIALRVFVLQVVFGIVVAAGMILVPFGVWYHTSFVFDKIKNLLFKIGLQFLFLSFVIGIIEVITRTWQKAPTDSVQKAAYMLVGTAALAMIANAADRLAGMAGGSAGGMLSAAIRTGTNAAAAVAPKAKAALKAAKTLKKGIGK